MGALVQDVKYALRVLSKTKVFTAVAMLTLALGIGASTAVFGLVNAVLLKPLPFPNAERIVFPWRLTPRDLQLGYNEVPWGLRQFHSLRRDSKTLQDVGAFKSDSFNLTGIGEPARLDGTRASAGFFVALGAAPAIGRVFTFQEDQVGHEHVVILSDRLRRDRFGANREILGRTIALSGTPYTVVGIMPPGFELPRAEDMPPGFDFARVTQLWVPLALPPEPAHSWDPAELAIIARLRSGITIDQAQAEMNVFSRRFESQYPSAKGWFDSRLVSITRQVAGDMRRPLLLILGAVGVVLLISCSNVASLFLARSFSRKREFTLRAALGAGDSRLIRQILTESLVLAIGGGLLGILLAAGSLRLVRLFGPPNIPKLGNASLDISVFAFAFGITFLTGILFGLIPAVGATRENLADSLKEASPRSAGSALGPRVRKALVVSQIALALVLVIAAGLLTRTFLHLLSVNPGFQPARVLTLELSLPASQYSDPERARSLYANVLRSLKSIPGVEAVGIAKGIPFGVKPDSTVVRIMNHPVVRSQERPYAAYNLASPGYFIAVGSPILRGRDFLESDTAPNAMPVTVINRAMAAKFWPDEDAIGKQVGLGSPAFPVMTVIGIVGDIKELSLRQQPGPEMYVPYSLKTYVSLLAMQVVLRTRIDPASMIKSVEAAVHSVDAGLPLSNIAGMTVLIDNSMAEPRFAMLLLGAFGALALGLASIGMYGVISYSVAQRTREIGLRMALGARAGDVFRMVIGQGVRLAAVGIVIGLFAASAAAKLMAAFLYGVEPIDPVTFGCVSLVLLAIAVIACHIPARRATRVDPLVALREE